MAPGNPKNNQPDTKEIPQINKQAALLILKQLIEDKQNNKINFSPLFTPVSRELSKQALIAFLKANQNLTKQLKARLELPFPIDVAIESEIPAVLQAIQEVFIINLPPEVREQEELEKTTLPNQEQLTRWQEELKLWEEVYNRAQQKTNQALPDFLSLKRQIELIQKFRGQVENITEKHLDEHWTLDERQQILQRVSEHLTQKAIEKKAPLTLLETQTLIFEACEQDFIVGVGLPTKERTKIAQELQQHFASPQVQQTISKLPLAQNSLNTILSYSSPNRNELLQLFQKELNLPPSRAEQLVRKLEKNWPKHSLPTQADIEQIVGRNLPLIGFVNLVNKGVPVESVPRRFWLWLEGYYKNTPLAQTLENFNLPISNSTFKWVDRLKKGLRVNPVVLDNWFRGVSSQFIAEERNKILPSDQPAQPGSEAEKLELLYQETKEFEKNFQNLPKLTKLRLTTVKNKLKLKQLVFFRHKLPVPTKLKVASKFISFWITKPKARLGGFIIKSGGKLITLGKNFISSKRGFGKIWGYLLKGSGSSLKFIGMGINVKGYIGKKIRHFFLKQSLKLLLGTILGIGTGGVGSAVSVLDFIYRLFKFLKAKEGKQAVKKIFSKIAQAVGGLFAGAGYFIAKFPLAILGSSLGFIAGGPAGALLGGSLGFWVQNTVGSVLTSIGSSVSSFFPTVATTTSVSGVIGTTVLAGVSGTGLMVLHSQMQENFQDQAFMAQPPEITIPGEVSKISIYKEAVPGKVSAGIQITYTITIISEVDNVEIESITDTIDTLHLENIVLGDSYSPGVFNPNQGTITWQSFTLKNAGLNVTFSYTATTKSNVTDNTKVKNSVVVNANIDGESLTRSAGFTVNSDGNDIAEKALQILANLRRGFWDFYNHSLDYDGNPSSEQDLFDDDEYKCCPNHCYISSSYPSGCTGDPSAIRNANSMFWCTWLVIKAYQATGHNVPIQLGVAGMYENWTGQRLSPSTHYSELDVGDVIFFKKKYPDSSQLYWAHVGIICQVSPDYIVVCESNNDCLTRCDSRGNCTGCNYTVSQSGYVQNKNNLIIGGFGKP